MLSVVDSKTPVYWLVSNLAGAGPSIYMLLGFSGLRMDMLPLWLHNDRPWVVMERLLGTARGMLS
jgi:hypothetical protein